MNNDEIKALLRELKERSDEEGSSGKVKISFDKEEPPVQEKKPKKPRRWLPKKTEKPEPAGTEPGAAKTAAEPAGTEPETAKTATEPTGVKPGAAKTAAEPAGAEPETAKTVTESKRPERPARRISEQEPGSQVKESAGGQTKRKTSGQDTDFGDEADFRETDELLLEARRNGAGSRGPWQNLKLAVKDYFDDLKSKGIGGKELVMIGAGFLLIIFLIFAVSSAIFSEDKSVNVTADEGLYVTVEQEPEEWCSSGTVELGIRAGSQIQSIMVNGETCAFEGKNRTNITLEADAETLELMVVTAESVLRAQVEIPMIDAEQPVVSISQADGQVTINAADGRSGLAGVYYGTAWGFSEIPLYQEYTGPFAYEQGKTYYYYAKDAAGNYTTPVATNMEPAQGLVFSDTEVTLFPGESVRLSVSASPELSYYNNLQLTNQNEEVASLAEDGTVTALQEGQTVITASADGLAQITCQVNVITEASVTISTLGDCTLGTDVNLSTANSFDTVYSMYGYSYFFQNVRDILSQDDITFANFEGTLTTSEARESKEYAFKGSPEYTEILKDGSIEAVTLANNHSSDYGAQSLEDTKQYLTEAGIDYCIGDEVAVKEVNGVKVGLVGIYVLDTGLEKASQVESSIEAVRALGAQIVVVAFHWGTEKSTEPDETQQTLAHLAVDCGADLVVGHHPHVLQGIELYQGKYIAYSLGNFCFGGNSTPSDTDTMIFQMTFTLDAAGTVQNGQVNIIPCSITSQSGWNNYQPTPAEGTEAQRILDKINEYSAVFGVSF